IFFVHLFLYRLSRYRHRRDAAGLHGGNHTALQEIRIYAANMGANDMFQFIPSQPPNLFRSFIANRRMKDLEIRQHIYKVILARRDRHQLG
ncbi:MAG: hypothetical protein JAY75_11235, partial [Candidatus Thiodiazotropha taylori]|nr:hypothetical protein [Candidatus Thiodiazotropha taylori]MCW4308790.1 hypothetical protein [Candidatus Thiodiazotropha endolucinida]